MKQDPVSCGNRPLGIMKILVTIASLLVLTDCRRHLCDDGTRPICPNGYRAVYNRPTGNNYDKSSFHPPPVCGGDGSPICIDGSTPKVRFNTCTSDEKKCPTGQGWGSKDKPFSPCADGSKCSCPAGGKNCSFHYRVCSNGQGCRKMCRKGQPHCPWFTKNRNKHDGNKEFNKGEMRPGNKGHNWGPYYIGNL